MRVLKAFLFLLFLSGCAGESQVFTDTFRLVYQGQSKVDTTQAKSLDTRYRYLRVVVDGRTSLTVLGYLDNDVTTGEVTDVWYSGQNEVVKLKGGRIVALTGTPFDWVEARTSGAPTWEELLANAAPIQHQFIRERDEAARYRYGISEKVTLQRIVQPIQHALAGVQRANLVWFKESYDPKNLPDSVFAVAPSEGVNVKPQVVYSRQCLTIDFCLVMQAWRSEDQDATMQNAKQTAAREIKP